VPARRVGKEKAMPTLRNLVEEIQRRRLNPDVHIEASTYDDVIDQAEDDAAENPDED
jgi:hypothetical protein